MRVYYAHAMCTYGTDIEQEEIKLIKAHLPNSDIINPEAHEGNPEKSLQGMKYCFRLIDGCDVLVFSKLLQKITAGVGLEVNFALSKKIPVYLLQNAGLKRVEKPVRYLSREDTMRHYKYWRSITGRTRIREKVRQGL